MADGLSRRSFLKLAATAGAAAALPGCEPAARKIIPYVVPDENVIPGVPSFFATTCAECPAGCGVVARVMEGRVIKLEGNPYDPISQGAICARGQGALQGLYNPDRLSKPQVRRGDGSLQEISWEQATGLFNDKLKAAANAGKGRVAFIGTSQGPTLDKVAKVWGQSWGTNRVVFWERFSDEPARAAAKACFGSRALPVYRLDQADTIVSFGADFLETWGSPVEFSRQFAEFRAPKMRKGTLSIGRAAYCGPRLGATGAKCDEWVEANPGAEGLLAMAVLNVIVNQGWLSKGGDADVAAAKKFAASYDPESVSKRTGVPAEAITRIASWMGQAESAVALPGGDDPQTYIACYILNSITGNLGRTMLFLENPPPETTSTPDEVRGVMQAIHAGQVDVVVVAGGANPAYSMPPSWGASAALSRAPYVIWMGEVPDETAKTASLLIPTHHALESWRDTSPKSGVYGLGQPVMQPVFPSRATHDILIESAHLGAGASAQNVPWENASDAVNAAWQEMAGKVAPDANPTDFWNNALRNGGYFREAKPIQARLDGAVLQQPLNFPATRTGELMLAAFPHIFLYDGRGADKPWLQEIPEPVTQIVWDSWIEVHPDTAAQLGLKRDYEEVRLYAGVNVVEVSTPYGEFEATVHITPLVKRGVLAVPTGQGHELYGRYAANRGVNILAFVPEGSRGVPVQVRRTDKKYTLATPLSTSDMMGRSISEAMSLDDLAQGLKPPIEREIEDEMPKVPYEMYYPFAYPGHKWGMTIDLNACNGCSACVAACYAENNLQVVGKDGVNLGRIMSWLRIERYVPTEEERKQGLLLHIMPMLCQQCEQAPCEPVCPVFASSHTREGLNAQIYNRCVGTRFCENNCPYKVRRFNWFAGEWPAPLNLQLNPDVTVRGAGVMEKCTFCIQRITTAEINARTEERDIVDGEIVPACAQACPSRAITFGDLNDPNSAMMKRRTGPENKPRTYTSLHEFNTLPAITYLAALYQGRGKA